MRSRKVLGAIGFSLVGLLSCGGGSKDDTLLVSKIDDAVIAIQEVLGSAPKFFEINATPELINLFVNDGKGNAINFVYDGKKLLEETTSDVASGKSFDASTMNFDKAIYENVESELPDSTLRAFSVNADGQNGEVMYRIVIQSDMGGQFAVLVDPLGKILGSDGLTEPGFKR